MGRLLFQNARWVDPEGPLVRDGLSLLVEHERIVGHLDPDESSAVDAQRVDLGRALTTPGFIDLHLHGDVIFARDDAVDDAIGRLAASCPRHGTTAFLVTSVAWQASRLALFVGRASESMTQPRGSAALLGLHLEGPWISPLAAGAQPAHGIRPYRASEGSDLLDRGRGLVRMVTFAPEVEGASALLEQLTHRGIVPAAGHSLARASQLDRATEDGMTHVTHLFNAMGALHHREPGLAGHALADERLTCDLICDGAHVHQEFVRIAARSKGDRLVLITDRVEIPPHPGDLETDFGAGPVRNDGQALRLADGTLAGSSLTLDRALERYARFTGAPLEEAVAACTLRPARVLGIEADRGTLRPGARADFAVLDDAGALRQTWIGGEQVFASEPAA